MDRLGAHEIESFYALARYAPDVSAKRLLDVARAAGLPINSPA
jgi:hypothetical protein